MLRAFVEHVRLSTVIAIATFALIAARAWTTVDPYWDTLAYHWIFAARAAGICDSHCFGMPPLMEALYDGFPKLIHWLQGLLWRVTGTPAAGDVVNIAAVVALIAYLRARFAVPLAWGWLALLAIPAVQIGLTSTYVDVAVNAPVVIALLVMLRMLIAPDDDHRVDVAVALASLGVAVAGKFLMVPVAFLTWWTIMGLATRTPSMIGVKRRGVAFVMLAAAGAIVMFPTLARNAVEHANPFYPVGVKVGPVRLPGPFPMYQPNTVSLAWADSPQPIRWLVSVGEYDSFRGRPLPWTIGQGDVPHESPSFRMGGYFVGYVLGALAMLAWAARSARSARWAAAMMIALTALCAWSPASHELRYYMFWMMMLVCSVLAGAYSPAFASADQALRRTASRALVLIAGATVVLMTGAAFLSTTWVQLEDIVAPTEPGVSQVADGGVLCIRGGSRLAFLYADIFHPPRHYATRSLVADEPDERCTTRVTPPY